MKKTTQPVQATTQPVQATNGGKSTLIAVFAAAPFLWLAVAGTGLAAFWWYNKKKTLATDAMGITQAEGVAVIRAMLLDSLARSPLLRQRNFSSDTLEFVIFSNGAAGEFSLKGPGSDKTVAGYLGNLISRLPEKWFPALAHPDDVMDLLDFPAEQNKIKIRANSVVKIRLYDTRPTGH